MLTLYLLLITAPVFNWARAEKQEESTTEINFDGCTCVPYYLCNTTTNSVITDGSFIIDVRLRNNFCDENLQICCNKPISMNPQNPYYESITNINKNGCGWRNVQGVGHQLLGNVDNEAQFAEFPWMVGVFRRDAVKDNIYICGGSLIHPSVVLTTAHNLNGEDFIIRAGEWDIQTKDEILSHQDRLVRKIIIHNDYNNRTLFNDLALLILQEPVKLARNVDVVCLPPANLIPGQADCLATGWGQKTFNSTKWSEGILKRIGLPIVPKSTCENYLQSTRLGKTFKLHTSVICAGGETNRDTCTGDGGSPLICPLRNQPNRYYQAGIVSWGIGCGSHHVPGVYVNVPLFRKWIDQQMILNDFDTAEYTY